VQAQEGRVHGKVMADKEYRERKKEERNRKRMGGEKGKIKEVALERLR
jgi:hypothetical protein